MDHYTKTLNPDGTISVVDNLAVAAAQLSDIAGYADTPLATYTHSGNKEVVVTAVDVDANTFTSAGHGLTAGKAVTPVPNDGTGNCYPVKYYPTGITFSEYYIIADGLTADVFKLSTTNGGASIDITANAEIDLTKWHFEVHTNSLTISGLPLLDKCKLAIRGRHVIDSCYLTFGTIPAYGQEWFKSGVTTYTYCNLAIKGDVHQDYEIFLNYEGSAKISIRGCNLKSNTTSANVFSIVNSMFISPKYSDGTFDSITLVNWGVLNGFTVEVYRV